MNCGLKMRAKAKNMATGSLVTTNMRVDLKELLLLAMDDDDDDMLWFRAILLQSNCPVASRQFSIGQHDNHYLSCEVFLSFFRSFALSLVFGWLREFDVSPHCYA